MLSNNKHITPQLMASFYQHKLDEKQQSIINAHIESCKECKLLSEKIKNVVSTFSIINEMPTNDLNWNKIQSKIRTSEKSSSISLLSLFLRKPLIASALSFVIIAVISFFVFKQHMVSIIHPTYNNNIKNIKISKNTDNEKIIEHTIPINGDISLISGILKIAEPDTDWNNVNIGQTVDEGDRIKNENGISVLNINNDSCVFADSKLALDSLQSKDIVIHLNKGKIFCQIEKISNFRLFEVKSSGISTAVTGTIFGVEKIDNKLIIYVTRGQVKVYNNKNIETLLDAPAKLEILLNSESDQNSFEVGEKQSIGGSELEVINSFIDNLYFVKKQNKMVKVIIPEYSDVSKIVIGKNVFTQFPLQFLHPPVNLSLEIYNRNNHKIIKELQLSQDMDTQLVELNNIFERSIDNEIRYGYLPPETIKQVVEINSSNLRNCYEMELKRNPNIIQKLLISFRIGSNGRILRANSKITYGSQDTKISDCVIKLLQKIVFPPPRGGGIVDVEYPISFTPSL